MALKVEIVSRETIKPSSPTPENLRIYKLSFLDQLQIQTYIHIIFFYSTIPKLDKTSNIFKKSLSETLTHMYPLAGRIKDIFSVECNDQGIEYIEAQVSDTMSDVIEHPKIHLLQQLLPPDPQSMSTNPCDQVLLSAQMNHFACGGTAFGVLISHRITDLLSACTFLKTWAAIARGENIIGNFVVDSTTMFPPQDVRCLNKLQITNKQEECKTKANRFVFSSSNITALREKAIKSGSCSQHPSRVVAVTALIWAAVIVADGGRKNCFMCTTINLRKWIDPPILPHSIGNFVHGATALWEPVEESIDYGVLVKRVKDSIESVNGDYVKRFADDDYFSNYVRGISEYGNIKDKMKILRTNSWCRAPIYEIDFGLGKPNWVGTIRPVDNNCVHLRDTSDGEGIEAWVKLSEEDMIKIEQNPEFLAYVSSCENV